jgi:methionyl-tRNA formyltransferase
MKIILHGQQAFGKAVLENLLENNKNIVAVCSAPDIENLKVDPLVELAEKRVCQSTNLQVGRTQRHWRK